MTDDETEEDPRVRVAQTVRGELPVADLTSPGHSANVSDMSSYTKLYGTILDSSVWACSKEVRILWVSLLAMASKNGVVHASIGGLARRANLTPDEVREALSTLAGPDPDDKSGVNEGRRIVPMQGSWQLVNHEFYREAKSLDAVRKAQWRARQTVSETVQETDPSTSTSTNSRSGEDSLSSAPAPDALARVRVVFDDWRSVHNHPTAKLDAKRTARIRRALASYDEAQLGKAFRGALKDDWLMGRDPKSPRKYDGLETLLRDAAQIERLIELESGKGKAQRRSATGSVQRDEGVDPMKFFKGSAR